MKEHAPSDWVVSVPATIESYGTRVKTCVVCGKTLKTESFALTEEEYEAAYKAQCKSIPYDDLQRNPKETKGKLIKLSGKIYQIIEEAESNDYYSVYFIQASNNLYLIYIDNYASGTRILEGDRITAWGVVDDLYTYETIMGNANTVPSIIAVYYE